MNEDGTPKTDPVVPDDGSAPVVPPAPSTDDGGMGSPAPADPTTPPSTEGGDAETPASEPEGEKKPGEDDATASM